MSALLTLLDDIYGVLFLPQATLTALRNRQVAFQGGVVIVVVNLMEAFRRGIITLLPQVLSSLVAWFLVAFLLERLGSAFGKEIHLDRLLGLIGFASLPWIFFAPAVNFGGAVGAVCALGVVIWFTVWQVWAVAVALEAQVSKVLSLIPLAFAGSIVSLILLFNSIGVLLDITNLLHLSKI